MIGVNAIKLQPTGGGNTRYTVGNIQSLLKKFGSGYVIRRSYNGISQYTITPEAYSTCYRGGFFYNMRFNSYRVLNSINFQVLWKLKSLE